MDGIDLLALSDAVECAVHGYDGRTGDLRFEIAPDSIAMSYGNAAVSMRWAQAWLLYFRWMAAKTASELTAVPR